MRILTLSYEYPPVGGGGAKVVAGVSGELARLGHEVDLLTMGFGDLPHEEVVDGVRVYRLTTLRRSRSICRPHEMLGYLIRAAPMARRLARRRRYDINHTHFLFPDAVLARILKRSLRLPYVVTAHGSDVPGFNPDRFVGLHRILAPLWRSVTLGSEQVVCPSEYLRSLVLAAAPSARTTIIPNGFEAQRFDSSRVKKNRILVVSRLFRRKGVQYLLRALAGTDLEYEVTVVGDGPYFGELRHEAAALNVQVDFRGWLENQSDELRQLYETSSIFVFVSSAENFPVVLLEAMSAGMAIVTTDDTGCREALGDAGILVPHGDPLALRTALERLTSDSALRDRLSAAARHRVERQFDWSIIGRRYEAALARHAAPSEVGPEALSGP